MTNTEARKIPYNECKVKCVACEEDCENMLIGECRKRLEALEQESCEDCISREGLLKKCVYAPIAPVIKGDSVHYEDIVFARDIINAEPIKQEPKTDNRVKNELNRVKNELEQEPVIDKIRAEIAEFEERIAELPNMAVAYATVWHCLNIIDKYKMESEVNE